MFPALAGGFLTTAPPGKPSDLPFKMHCLQENRATLPLCMNWQIIFPLRGKEAAVSRGILILPPRTPPLTFSKAPRSHELVQGFPGVLPPEKKKKKKSVNRNPTM